VFLPIDSPPVSLRLNAKRGMVTGLDAACRVRIREWSQDLAV